MTTNKYRKQQRAQLKVEVVKCWLTTEPSGEAGELEFIGCMFAALEARKAHEKALRQGEYQRRKARIAEARLAEFERQKANRAFPRITAHNGA
jgi:hypothetical protein